MAPRKSKEMGRPTKYSKELGTLICGLISEGQSLRKICVLEGMPNTSTVCLWVLKGAGGEELYVDFSKQYARAVEMRTEYWAEEIVDISDDSEADYIFTEDGKRITNAEAIARSRLKVDTRKWLMGKLKPKKYGERTTQEIVGDKENPLQIQQIEIVHVKPSLTPESAD